jgi:hypothetical protein
MRVYVIEVGDDRQFRAETYVKRRFNPQRFEPAVEIEKRRGKKRSDRRGDHGDHFITPPQIPQKTGGVVNYAPGFVGADVNTVPAADTKVMVYPKFIPRTVHTVFYRAVGNTGVAIGTFFFIDLYDRSEVYSLHKIPPKNANFGLSCIILQFLFKFGVAGVICQGKRRIFRRFSPEFNKPAA